MEQNPPLRPPANPPRLVPVPQTPDIIGLTTRLRLTEEKANNLNKKLELIERNFISSSKKQNETLHALDSDILELKREINLIKQKTDLIVRELKMTSGKDEVNTIKRYLDLWDLTRFVSRNELDHIIDEKLQSFIQKVEKETEK